MDCLFKLDRRSSYNSTLAIGQAPLDCFVVAEGPVLRPNF